MKTIAFINQKGGTGKTLTTATFARCLAAEHGKRVLLSDTDPSGNLTQYMGVDSFDNGMWNLLRFGFKDWATFTTTTPEGIDIIAADTSLGDADVPGQRICTEALLDLSLAMAERDAYDYHLIDCHPYLGVLSMVALIAADEVIIPVNLDEFSLAGMAELLRQVEKMREYNPRLRVAGILPTRYTRTIQEFENHQALLEQCPFPVFGARIRASAQVVDSIGRHESLLQTSTRCGASVDYRLAVQEYLKGVGCGG